MKASDKEKMGIQLSKQTAERLREYAKKEGRTLYWLFEEAVKKYLDEHDK